ncbi:MAG: DciA family protein [Sphingobium sp.]
MTQSPSAEESAPARPRRKRADKTPNAERQRVGGVRAIADLMPEIGGAAFRKFGFIQSSIVTRWAEIAGERHAALSTPESIRFPAGRKSDGTLHLIVSGAHAPILQHVVPELIERVNRFFGYNAVARIAIRQGQIHREPPADRPPPRMLRPIPVEVGEGLRDIGDPELRAVLEAMAGGLHGGARPPRIS